MNSCFNLFNVWELFCVKTNQDSNHFFYAKLFVIFVSSHLNKKKTKKRYMTVFQCGHIDELNSVLFVDIRPNKYGSHVEPREK